MTAWALVEADARGVNSHGVGRLEFYETTLSMVSTFRPRSR